MEFRELRELCVPSDVIGSGNRESPKLRMCLDKGVIYSVSRLHNSKSQVSRITSEKWWAIAIMGLADCMSTRKG